MNTYESLKNDIINLGIKPQDVIKIHSSMKKIGETQGGADTVLDVFCDYLGQEGLLVLPAHTWGTVKDYDYIYNPDTTPSNLGLLPNLFRQRKGVHRSIHPTHSVCAFGKGAGDFVSGTYPQITLCGKESCYKKLYDLGAKVLLLGVTLTSNTFFHWIEEWREEEVPPSHFDKVPMPCKIELSDGNYIDNPVYLPPLDTSKQFDRVLDVVLKEKSTVTGKIGQADCILIDCKKIFCIISELLDKNPKIFY